ncbi:MAG: TonB C-terminal domain-containing protein [Deltaproteobacteria bacterium]|nr:TonB C-terminal domain-containing protein [Deltaproteobacteria bacterium]
MSTRLPSFVTGSIVAHTAVALGALFIASKQPPPRVVRTPQTVELEFAQPPAANTPTPAPQPPPMAQQPPPTPLQPQVAARVIRDPSVRTQPELNPNPNTTGTTTGDPDPNPTPAATGPTTTGPTTTGPASTGRVLTAAELMNPSATEMMVAANAGGVGMPSRGEIQANRQLSRDIFGTMARRCTGTPEECARAVAMAPIVAALGSQQRPMPPGSGAHIRQVGRRAEESFLPVRQIPEIGAIVSRAPIVTPPTTVHQGSAGENAVARDLDQAHGQSFAMGSGSTVAIPAPPYRMVRAEIEVDQDAQGTILGTRVAQSSRSSVYDQAAERAIRDALGEADAFRTPGIRRSRWVFEVSEAARDGQIWNTIRGAGNEGWHVIPEESHGVRLRYRVRNLGMRMLPAGAPEGTTPQQPGRSG